MSEAKKIKKIMESLSDVILDEGAWGHDIMDNDTARDVEAEYEDKVENGTDPAEALSQLLDEFRPGLTKNSWGMTKAEHILALGWLAIEYETPVSDDLRGAVNAAIDLEMDDEELRNWNDPKQRASFLEKFRSVINGEVPAHKKSGKSWKK